ncbi:MAG: hypothetical protein LBH00_11010 [Planctomycetaceae bacterium]|nr:hypothetical protein [Planctomycetaceae bacterium]
MIIPRSKKELEELIAREDRALGVPDSNGHVTMTADLAPVCTSVFEYKGKKYVVNGSQFIRWSKPELPEELVYKIAAADDTSLHGGTFHGALTYVDGITWSAYSDEDGNVLRDDE